MNLLARREHSETELYRKLTQKGHEQESVSAVIQALLNEGLLSTSRFTECYIRARRERGYGPVRIHAELLARGVPEDMIEHHLNINDNAWFIAAHKVWRKRFKNTLPRDFKMRAQQARFLQYRGFTSEQIENIYQSDPEHA